MRNALFVLLLPALIAGCRREAATPRVEKAWVRLPAVPGRPGAGYFTIDGGTMPARLVAVDSPSAGASELHESMGRGGMTTMKPLDGVDVPAGGEVRFQPGGDHVMLFGLAETLKPGAAIPLVLRFANGPSVAVSARAVATGDAPPY